MIYDKVFNDTTDTLSFSVPGPAGTLRYQIDQTASYATAAAMDAAAGSAAIVGDEVGSVGQNSEVIDTSSLAVGTWYIHLVWNNGQDTVPASTAFTIAAVDNVGSAAGSALVLGVGASIAAAAGVSDGVAVVTAVGSTGGAVEEGAGASAGIATVSGIGAATVAASGSSAGAATVSGVGATAGGFDPASLFGSGDKGIIIDPSDLSSLWTDTGKTTNVTTDGEAVAVIEDLAGKTADLSQSGSSNRALYKTSGGLHWLLPDRTDDFYTIPASFIDQTKSVTVVAAVRTDSGVDYLFDANDIARGSLSLQFLFVSGSNWRFQLTACSSAFSRTAPGSSSAQFQINQDRLLTSTWNRSSGTVTQWVDRVSCGSATATAFNLRTPAGYELFRSSATNSLCFGGRLYFLCIIDRALTSGELADLEQYAADKAGITL